MIEQWKLVQGFEHQYAISNYGNIKNTKTNRLLKAIDQSMIKIINRIIVLLQIRTTINMLYI